MRDFLPDSPQPSPYSIVKRACGARSSEYGLKVWEKRGLTGVFKSAKSAMETAGDSPRDSQPNLTRFIGLATARGGFRSRGGIFAVFRTFREIRGNPCLAGDGRVAGASHCSLLSLLSENRGNPCLAGDGRVAGASHCSLLSLLSENRAFAIFSRKPAPRAAVSSIIRKTRAG